MANQETAEYYNWLFQIEAQEFKKELLVFVSSHSYLMRKVQSETFTFILESGIVNNDIIMIVGP